MIKDRTLYELFRSEAITVCVPMTKLARKTIKETAKLTNFTVSQVVSRSLAYYLYDLEDRKLEFPKHQIGETHFLEGKTKNFFLRMTKTLYDILRDHARQLDVHEHEIVAMAIATSDGGVFDKWIADAE